MASKQARSFLKKRTKQLFHAGTGPMDKVFLLLFVHKKKTLPSLEGTC
jgi:hypothetical protein